MERMTADTTCPSRGVIDSLCHKQPEAPTIQGAINQPWWWWVVGVFYSVEACKQIIMVRSNLGLANQINFTPTKFKTTFQIILLF